MPDGSPPSANGHTRVYTPSSPRTTSAVSSVDRAGERALRLEIRTDISQLLGERHLMTPDHEDEERIRQLIRDRVEAYQRRAVALNAPLLDDPDAVTQRLFDGLLRMGILEPFMQDPTIEELLVNSPGRVFVFQYGQKRLVPDLFFDDDAEVRQLVKRLIGPLGRRLDESSPMVDVRLPDGSRLNAAIPPATTRWCCLCIRKFTLRAQSLRQLVDLGTLTDSAARFLDAAVQAGVNIVVSGPTGAGKTTFLNALGTSIASLDERLVTIEEVTELQLERQLPDCIALQARAGNIEGAGEISIRDLMRNALRMRPTRIVVGECRAGEALDMLQAMNTGHPGSMTTLHANAPRDALDRIVTMAMMAEERLSSEVLTKMVANTIELVIQLRFDANSGKRLVSCIYEVTGMEAPPGGAPVIVGHDLWTLERARGRLEWTGIQPRCLARFAERGVRYALPPVPEARP